MILLVCKTIIVNHRYIEIISDEVLRKNSITYDFNLFGIVRSQIYETAKYVRKDIQDVKKVYVAHILLSNNYMNFTQNKNIIILLFIIVIIIVKSHHYFIYAKQSL